MAFKNDTCTEVLGESSRKILLDILGQLRSGMELSRITLPVFILEPISMLERITNFSAHPNLLLKQVYCFLKLRCSLNAKHDQFFFSFISAIDNDNSESRFISAVQYFISGWHVKPKVMTTSRYKIP
jgi:hypothetical protein